MNTTQKGELNKILSSHGLKACFNCESLKSIGDFHKDGSHKDGMRSICKDCATNRSNAWSIVNRDMRLKNNKARYNADPQKIINKTNQWRRDNIDKVNAASRKWRKENRDKMLESTTRYKNKYPEKISAQAALNFAVRHGKVVRPSKCSICLSIGTIHGHHEDYSKQLDVVWVCPCCHSDIHNQGEK